MRAVIQYLTTWIYVSVYIPPILPVRSYNLPELLHYPVSAIIQCFPSVPRPRGCFKCPETPHFEPYILEFNFFFCLCLYT